MIDRHVLFLLPTFINPMNDKEYVQSNKVGYTAFGAPFKKSTLGTDGRTDGVTDGEMDIGQTF